MKILKMNLVILLMSQPLNISAATYYAKIEMDKNAYSTTIDWKNTTSFFTDWLNENGAYDYSIFSPLISNQTNDFTQTMTNKQDQTRYEQPRQIDEITGRYRDVGEPILHEQTIIESQERLVSVVDLGWIDVNSVINCEVWSPDVSDVLFGEEFTQSRQCDQERSKTLEYYIESNFESNFIDNDIFTVIEEQQNTGENVSSGWVTSPSIFTTWQNDGGHYNESSWSPVINNQTIDFSQSRNYDQNQERYEQGREQNIFTSEYRDVGAQIRHEQTLNDSESRTITTSIGGWVNDGVGYDCTDWTPLAETVLYGDSFTQNRNCSQNQVANISYKEDALEIGTGSTTQTIFNPESRNTTGIKVESVDKRILWDSYLTKNATVTRKVNVSGLRLGFTNVKVLRYQAGYAMSYFSLSTPCGSMNTTGTGSMHTSFNFDLSSSCNLNGEWTITIKSNSSYYTNHGIEFVIQ